MILSDANRPCGEFSFFWTSGETLTRFSLSVTVFERPKLTDERDSREPITREEQNHAEVSRDSDSCGFSVQLLGLGSPCETWWICEIEMNTQLFIQTPDNFISSQKSENGMFKYFKVC